MGGNFEPRPNGPDVPPSERIVVGDVERELLGDVEPGPEDNPSVAIREFEEVEAELRRVAGLVRDVFCEFDQVKAHLKGHGIEMDREMPHPLPSAYQSWRARVDGREDG